MVWYGFNLYARTEYSKVKQKSITLDKNTFFKKKNFVEIKLTILVI